MKNSVLATALILSLGAGWASAHTCSGRSAAAVEGQSQPCKKKHHHKRHHAGKAVTPAAAGAPTGANAHPPASTGGADGRGAGTMGSSNATQGGAGPSPMPGTGMDASGRPTTNPTSGTITNPNRQP